MNNLANDIIIDIGKLILKVASENNEEWDYAGYMFETKDGKNSGGEIFSFKNSTRQSLSFGRNMKTITSYFKRLRELTLVEGDKYWIKCNVVARKDGEVKILFEYDDDLKWKITPDNFEQAYEILVGDLFPEILKDKT